MNKEIEYIIVNILSGEASYDDTIRFSEWIAHNDENKETFLKIKKYWDADVSGIKPNDSIELYQNLQGKIQRAKPKALTLKPWFRYIGIGIAAMFIGFMIHITLFVQEPLPLHYYTHHSGNSVSDLTLPDGTQISLNKNSSLSYTNLFGDKNREVQLTGEGFFHVTRDENREFIVDAHQGKIVVLGTVFNVKETKEDGTISATLLEGSVRFETHNQHVMLKPNQQVIYNKASDEIRVSHVDTDLVTAWKDRLIKYKSITFAEFVHLLEKFYDDEIAITDTSLETLIVSGTFDSQLSVEQILDIMKQSVFFKWRKKGDIYEIYK